jgi:hypothetical protein
MKAMKRLSIIILTITALVIFSTSCDRGNLSLNPNAAGENAIINPDLFVNRLTFEMYDGGGVADGYANNVLEGPWWPVHRRNQYFVSNYSYYWGSNFYNWTNTANAFSILKYAVLLQQQANAQGAANLNQNVYLAIAKFFKVYSFIWYSQRVGDIPFSQAGNANVTTPKFDTQHDVYKGCLATLDSANTLMGAYITKYPGNTNSIASAGDIYGLTNLQWQKVINSYKLRVLISLSKRAVDNADLNIPAQFANIVNNPATYPVMSSNADNLVFHFNAAYNPYPIKAYGVQPYSQFANVSSTFLNLTTATSDPRTFIAATPAPAQVTALGSPPLDFSNAFSAFVGADIGMVQGTINGNSANGMYSFGNYNYYESNGGTTCEPGIVMGYPELCFNVAEGINLGWAAGNDGQWYLNGVNASLSFYTATYPTFKDGGTFPINDKGGNSLGTAKISFANFLSNIAYQGGAAGLTQILQQKYVAMWQNSGWEPYYNWRRTGVPAFSQGEPGIGTSNDMIPIRWLYDNNEIVANSTNYNAALQSQYGGTDDVTKAMWLIK